MGNIGEKIRFQSLHATQLRHHLVEIVDHAVKIVLVLCCVHGRDINGKIALGYLAGGIGQPLHRHIIGLLDTPAGKNCQARSDY